MSSDSSGTTSSPVEQERLVNLKADKKVSFVPSNDKLGTSYLSCLPDDGIPLMIPGAQVQYVSSSADGLREYKGSILKFHFQDGSSRESGGLESSATVLPLLELRFKTKSVIGTSDWVEVNLARSWREFARDVFGGLQRQQGTDERPDNLNPLKTVATGHGVTEQTIQRGHGHSHLATLRDIRQSGAVLSEIPSVTVFAYPKILASTKHFTDSSPSAVLGPDESRLYQLGNIVVASGVSQDLEALPPSPR